MFGISDRIQAPWSGGFFDSDSKLHQWFQIGIELLYPPRCAGCDRVDTQWCESCQGKLDGTPILHLQRNMDRLEVASTQYHKGWAQKAIHALKYENVPILSDTLGKRLIKRLESLSWSYDLIVPVPLHPARLKERGYNQAELLGQVIHDYVNIPMQTDCLIRQRQTRSQVELDAEERIKNVEGAFLVESHLVQDQTILLIDDVLTTGATMNACANALVEGGARCVYGITVTLAN